jgi:hypothetical protein
MGNPEGEHALACEWVGSQLARRFNLPTFRSGIVRVTGDDELRFYRPGMGCAKAGPAFISEADAGEPWGGSERELGRLVNPQDVGRLVIFDTWIRNRDRYYIRGDGSVRQNCNNVFLSEAAPEGMLLLRAIDHTHCFTTGGREIHPRSLGIAGIRDETVYGLFPAFKRFLDRSAALTAVEDLREVARSDVEATIATIPPEWDVSASARQALAEFLVGRAAWLAAEVPQARHTVPRIMTMLWPQGELFPPSEPEKPK